MITKNVDGDIFDGRKQEKSSKNEKLKKKEKEKLNMRSWFCRTGSDIIDN